MDDLISMPNRKKPDAEKQSRPIVVNVTPDLKRDVDALAVSTGVTTSERVRALLEGEVAKWKAQHESGGEDSAE